nr:MAG TPA: hypothetical protein [Caudoviricetes sp.]
MLDCTPLILNGSQLCVRIFLHINVCVSHSKLYTIPVYDDSSIFSIFNNTLLPASSSLINLIFIFDVDGIFACFRSFIFLLSNTGVFYN